MKKVVLILLMTNSVIQADLGQGFGVLFQALTACWHAKKEKQKPTHSTTPYESNNDSTYDMRKNLIDKKRRVQFLIKNDQK